MTRRLLLLFVLHSILLTTTAATGAQTGPAPRVQLTTSMGDIVLELEPNRAPQTVKNFLSLVGSGHYDGTIFHRVIPGFMIQGGGLTADMQPRTTGETIVNEADNGLKNIRGSVAMARTRSPHSATSQFFINTVDNDSLNHRGKTSRGWGYCVFGRVAEGMGIVERIERVATTRRAGRGDVPVTPVIIEKAIVAEIVPAVPAE